MWTPSSSAAGELKYVGQIKRILAAQFNEPDDDFVRLFASRIYDGVITQKVREQFGHLTKATTQFLGDQINERLKSAISGNTQPLFSNQPVTPSLTPEVELPADEEKDLIVTTEEKPKATTSSKRLCVLS